MKTLNNIEKAFGYISTNVWLLLFVIANFLLKTFQISSQSLYGDEPYSIFCAQQSINDLIPVFLTDQNPPLHISLLHVWMNHFGITDVSAKMLSVTCSVLASGILFLFANKFIDKTTAIFVSFLFLFSNSQQYFATEVRPYALIQLLCISSFYIYYLLLINPKLKHLFFLFIINLLLIFTHYLTIFAFVVQFLGILFYFRKNRKTVIYYFISQVMVILVLLPWLKIAFSNIPKNGAFWNTIPNYFAFRWHVNILLGNEVLYYVFNGIVICSVCLFLLNKKINVFNKIFNWRYYLIFLLLYILPILLNFIVAQYSPVFTTRYFLYSLFGLFLFVAYSFSSLNIHSVFKTILFLPFLYLLFTSFLVVQERQDDWKHIVPDIVKLKKPNTLVYISASYKYKDFSFYYDIDAFKDYQHTIDRLAKEHVFVTPINESKGWEKLNFNLIQNVIYVQAHSQFEDSLNQIKPYIVNKGFTECNHFQKGGIQYTVFIRDTMECYSAKITSENTSVGCDLLEHYSGIHETTDSVEIYKTSFEYPENCPAYQGITDKIKYTGNHSFRINEANQFELGLIKPKHDLLKNKKNINVAAYVNVEEGNDGWLIVSVEKGPLTLFRNNIYLKESIKVYNKWQKITLSSLIPDDVPDDAVVKIYFWNPGKKNIFVDDFSIQVF